ncbi:hypothetical protein AAG906_027926 [Vitis piasezkii]
MVGNQKLNMDLTRAGLKKCLDLNELEEMRNDAYLNSKIAKARLKNGMISCGGNIQSHRQSNLQSQWPSSQAIHRALQYRQGGDQPP